MGAKLVPSRCFRQCFVTRIGPMHAGHAYGTGRGMRNLINTHQATVAGSPLKYIVSMLFSIAYTFRLFRSKEFQPSVVVSGVDVGVHF